MPSQHREERIVMALSRNRDTVVFDDALLSVRNPRTRASLIELILTAIEDVESGKAQRILLAARRMTCLYALLSQNGLVSPGDDVVVSDRFVELLDDGAWEGETVILLDDTTVTGHTLEARRTGAQRLVGRSGRVDTRVALDLSLNAPARDSTSLDLHNQFALAFGRNLLPFFTDFAISNETPISATALDRLLAAPMWKTVDVTNSVLAGSGSRAFSLFILDGLSERFRAKIGSGAKLVDLAKVRLFVDDNFGVLRVRVVPIVLTKDVTEASLQSWLGTLNLTSRSTSAQSAHAAGLAAIVLSRALFAVFAEYVRSELDIDFLEDPKLTQLAMGRHLSELAFGVEIKGLSELEVARDSQETDIDEPKFTWPGGRSHPGTHYIVAGDDVVKQGFRRLQALRGPKRKYTTLRDVAARSKSNVEASSVAIDVLNDLGYSVPVFAVRDGTVARSYRPGEASVRFEDLVAGPLGGRLASVANTIEVPDDDYFDEENLRDSRAIS